MHQGYGAPGGFPSQQYAPQYTPRPAGGGASKALLIGLGVAALALVGLLAFVVFSSRDGGEVAVQYQNEDYQVPTAGNPPPLPMPTTVPEAEAWLTQNALYSQTLAEPVRCDLQLLPNPGSQSDPELESRMREYLLCLTRVWGPSLEAAGFTPTLPNLMVYPGGTQIQTPCGKMPDLNAFYCGGDQNIYLAGNVTKVLSPETMNQPVVYELIIGHEYGHGVQGRTGMFVAGFALQDRATDEAQKLELNRRAETQADCLATAALRSLGQSMGLTEQDYTDLLAISDAIGDDSLNERFGGDSSQPGNHGTGANRELWAGRGLGSGDLARCNTWVAPSDEVR